MSPNEHNLPAEFQLAWPIERWESHKVVVAVSGGADSVALLRLLQGSSKFPHQQLIVAHYNHGWRGEESDKDEEFVGGLATQLSLPFHCRRRRDFQAAEPADDSGQAGNSGQGAESLARDARYNYLQQIAGQTGARYLATAHNADDQAETVLHRILRGTGITGLAGIPAVRYLGDGVSVVRPLLDFSRRQVLNYLKEIDQPFRVDSSNNDPKFTRNRIRQKTLPELRENFGEQVDDNLRLLGNHAQATQQLINQLVSFLVEKSIEHPDSNSASINCQVLAAQPAYLQDPQLIRELIRHVWKDKGWPLRDMDATRWKALANMVSDHHARQNTFPGNVTAERCNTTLLLRRQVHD